MHLYWTNNYHLHCALICETSVFAYSIYSLSLCLDLSFRLALFSLFFVSFSEERSWRGVSATRCFTSHIVWFIGFYVSNHVQLHDLDFWHSDASMAFVREMSINLMTVTYRITASHHMNCLDKWSAKHRSYRISNSLPILIDFIISMLMLNAISRCKCWFDVSSFEFYGHLFISSLFAFFDPFSIIITHHCNWYSV